MEERRKADRRDPAAREALSPETLQLLRLCGANVRSADDPEQQQAGEPADRRRRPASGTEARRAPAPTRR